MTTLVKTATIEEAARQGLSMPPGLQTIPSDFSYHGNNLFPMIAEDVPEYYQGRDEAAHLRLISRTLASHLHCHAVDAGKRLVICEFGPSTGVKSCELLRALGDSGFEFLYLGLDHSETALDAFRQNLPALPDGAEARLIACDAFAYLRDMEFDSDCLYAYVEFGGGIGNGDADSKFQEIRSALPPGSLAVLGYHDAGVPRREILAAYNDKGGVTAAFIKNALVQINCLYGGDFNPDAFAYVPWLDDRNIVHMELEPLEPQEVRVSAWDLAFTIEPGQRILVSSSAKWHPHEFRTLLFSNGLEPLEDFRSPTGRTHLILASC